MQSSFAPFPQNLHLTALIVTSHQQWHRNVELYFLVFCPTSLFPLTFHTNYSAIKTLIKTSNNSTKQTAFHRLSACLSVVWTHSKCSSSCVLRVSQINRLSNGILVNNVEGSVSTERETHFMFFCMITLVVELLARGQCPEGPATGHLDTGFSWFPCVYKQMLRWFPRSQVATTCFSCRPPT